MRMLSAALLVAFVSALTILALPQPADALGTGVRKSQFTGCPKGKRLNTAGRCMAI